MPRLLGFSLYIKVPKEISGEPQVRNITSSIDLQANLISLDRLNGESNSDYRDRMWDVSVHRGGPLYEGVVNNIARELGMLRSRALTIDLKKNSDGSPIAPSPRVDILANRVVLYSDWRPNGTAIIDKEIRIYQLDDSGYYLDDLAAAINISEYFSATLDASIRPNTISNTLIRGTSNLFVPDERVRADGITKLNYDCIVRNSVSFIEKEIFTKEITGTPSVDGEYSIDYTAGEVQVYLLPSGRNSCSYMTAVFPMIVDSVPVQIFTFQDDDFQYELFEKTTLSSGTIAKTVPNIEGSEIYHQLFKETQVFWGK